AWFSSTSNNRTSADARPGGWFPGGRRLPEANALSTSSWSPRAFSWPSPVPAGKNQVRAVERLLEKYPELRELPVRQRGRVLYHKLQADLLAGIPLGIWSGVLFVLICSVGIATIQVVAAGPLLRGQRPWLTMRRGWTKVWPWPSGPLVPAILFPESGA